MSIWFWLFCLSVVINFFALYYVRWLIKSLEVVNEDISLLNVLIVGFRQHLEGIYELETFYGDDTLKALLQHSRDLTEQLEGIDLVINEENQIANEET